MTRLNFRCLIYDIHEVDIPPEKPEFVILWSIVFSMSHFTSTGLFIKGIIL